MSTVETTNLFPAVPCGPKTTDPVLPSDTLELDPEIAAEQKALLEATGGHPHPLNSGFFTTYRGIESPVMPQLATLCGRPEYDSQGRVKESPVTQEVLRLRADLIRMLTEIRSFDQVDELERMYDEGGQCSYLASSTQPMDDESVTLTMDAGRQLSHGFICFGWLGSIPWVETGRSVREVALKVVAQCDAIIGLYRANADDMQAVGPQMVIDACADALRDGDDVATLAARCWEADLLLVELIARGMVTRAQVVKAL